MAESDRVSFRLGKLANPLNTYCQTTGQTTSQAIRQAVALMLRVEVPEMAVGNPNASRETAIAANRARWKGRKKAKRKK